jgi:2-polyprenyl-3-methyl-5-hydroxy-6-metoxy-1,4-benzoquinol methylase
MHQKNIEQLNFYDRENPDYLQYQNTKPYSEYLASKLVSQMPLPRNDVLEVGAGQGRFTFEISHKVKTVLATDISPLEIKLLNIQAKKLGIKNIKAQVLDLLNIKNLPPGKKFSHIVGVFILHHLPKNELPRVVNQLDKFLKPGGRLTFVENNNLSPAHLFAILIRKDMTWEVERGAYTNYIGIFKKACESQGLILKSSRKFGFFWPEIVSRYPKAAIAFSELMGKIPLVSEILCPFILLSVEKPAKFGR